MSQGVHKSLKPRLTMVHVILIEDRRCRKWSSILGMVLALMMTRRASGFAHLEHLMFGHNRSQTVNDIRMEVRRMEQCLYRR